jgi:hypothetical protein
MDSRLDTAMLTIAAGRQAATAILAHDYAGTPPEQPTQPRGYATADDIAGGLYWTSADNDIAMMDCVPIFRMSGDATAYLLEQLQPTDDSDPPIMPIGVTGGTTVAIDAALDTKSGDPDAAVAAAVAWCQAQDPPVSFVTFAWEPAGVPAIPVIISCVPQVNLHENVRPSVPVATVGDDAPRRLSPRLAAVELTEEEMTLKRAARFVFALPDVIEMLDEAEAPTADAAEEDDGDGPVLGHGNAPADDGPPSGGTPAEPEDIGS